LVWLSAAVLDLGHAGVVAQLPLVTIRFYVLANILLDIEILFLAGLRPEKNVLVFLAGLSATILDLGHVGGIAQLPICHHLIFRT
jgi:hypothetical protein